MLRFAPRYGIVSPCLHWGVSRMRTQRLTRHRILAANDNGAALAGRRDGANDQDLPEDALLAAALRMFAAHGLSAAKRACEAAEIARAGGDGAGASWWIAVCATLDGPMARAWAAQVTQPA